MNTENKNEMINEKAEAITERVKEILRCAIYGEECETPLPYSESGEMHESKIWFDPNPANGSAEIWATAGNYEYFADSGYILLAKFSYPNGDGWINSDMGYEGEENAEGEWEPTADGLEIARNDMFEQCWADAAPEKNINKAAAKWAELHAADKDED